jgi:hypothetical protein
MSEIRLEHRSVIIFFTKEGKGPKVFHQRMIAVYGNGAPSLFQIKFWSEQFLWSGHSVQVIQNQVDHLN